MKALFITHDISAYGASKSLQLLLNNLDGIEVDLIVSKRLFGRHDVARIKQKFGPAVRHVYQYYLPFDKHVVASFEKSPLVYIYDAIKSILWRWDRPRLYALARRNGYSFVHLNSLVLNPLIDPGLPFIIHIRELLDGERKEIKARINNARGVVFIDEEVKKPFAGLSLRQSVVLNNPVDMRRLAEARGQIQRSALAEDNKGKTVFSVIGLISEEKGVGFIIEAFRQMNDPQARLLIVGAGPLRYVNECKKAAAGDSRIIFHGEEDDMLNIYYLSDYVLRGEDRPRIGRTIYEGLYSDCGVIIPKGSGAIEMDDHDKFRDSIFFYPVRNAPALAQLLQKLTAKKRAKDKFCGNVEAYVKGFKEFVLKAIG
ncbi:MAG: glycosyltransferase [Candidatus Margulisbacteria bacterium]|nr:glycosyltransferase [Candidatus Margulisiibacteriota bacterium]